MKRLYMTIALVGFALTASNIWHSAVKAQTRTDRFQGNVQVLGTNLIVFNAGSPYLRATDTTNTVHTQILSGDTDGFIGTASDHRLQLQTNGATEMVITAAGDVGIGTTLPAVGLHGVVTDGLILWGGSEADNADKYARWGTENFDVDEEPFYAIQLRARVTDNELWLGGGWASGNAATLISFYAAANDTTTTGTLIMDIDVNGSDFRNDVRMRTTLRMDEIATPAVAPANQAQLYAHDAGGGKTELCVIFSTGNCIQIALQL